MSRNRKNKQLKFRSLLIEIAYPCSAICIILVTAEITSRYQLLSTVLLPSPSDVYLHLCKSFSELFGHLLITAEEAVLGFILATIIAVLFSISFALWNPVEKAILPLLIGLKCTPLVALAPFLALGFAGDSIFLKAVFAAFICFFPIVISLRTGLKHIDQEALDLFRSLSASRLQTLFKLQLPSALPHFFAGLKTASTFSVIGAVVGEFSLSDAGLGFYILDASNYGNTKAMFAAIILLILLGLTFFFAIFIMDMTISRFVKIQTNEHFSTSHKVYYRKE